MIERRRHPRTPANTPAQLLVHYQAVVKCVIRDLSVTGARLELGDTSHIPDVFDLIVADGPGFTCRVAWRRGNMMGVSFQQLEVGW